LGGEHGVSEGKGVRVLGGGHVACDGGVSECRPFPSENPDSPTRSIEAATPKGGRHGVRGAKGVKGKGVRVLKGQETTPAFGLAKTLGFPFT